MHSGTIAVIVSVLAVLPLANLVGLIIAMRKGASRIREINLARPMHRILRVLSLMPVVAIITLGVLVVEVFQVDRAYRSAYAVFLAGIVMTAVLQVIMQSIARGLAIVPLYISGLFSEVIVLAGAVYFALFRRFEVVFPSRYYLLPLILGAALIVIDSVLLAISSRVTAEILSPRAGNK